MMDDDIFLSPRFKTAGLINVDVNVNDEKDVMVRTNARSRAEFNKWLEVYCELTASTLNSYKLLTSGEGHRNEFSQVLVCHHNGKHLGKRKAHTRCPFKLRAFIKKVTVDKVKKDPKLKQYPCFLTIQGQHNHSSRSADALQQLRVLPAVKASLENLFEQGLGATQAARLLSMEAAVSGNLEDVARRDTNPSTRQVCYLLEKWRRSELGGCEDAGMMAALDKYAAAHPDLTIRTETDDSHYCIALVTPFMRRVHRQMQEAGEAVFVDVTAEADRAGSVLLSLLCASAAGALPLGVLIASSREEDCLTAGFSLLKDALGESKASFFGRGAPNCFITDAGSPERSALLSAWPGARQDLGGCHLLRRVWGWLSDANHGVRREERRQMLGVVKRLLQAPSPEEFSSVWEAYSASSLAGDNDSFTRYVDDLLKRKEEWAPCFRNGLLPDGRSTDSYAAATMCVIKDILFGRSKAHSACQLAVLMAEGADAYLRQRLVDTALGRPGLRRSDVWRDLSPDAVTEIELGTVFRVQGPAGAEYEVDLTVRWCSCAKGSSGGLCKHQVACAEVATTALPQCAQWSNETRQWLVSVALGCEAAPAVELFDSLAGRTDTTQEPPQERREVKSLKPDPTDPDWSDSADADDPADPAEACVAAGSAGRPSTEELLASLRTAISLGDGLTEMCVRHMLLNTGYVPSSADLNTALCSAPDTAATARGGVRTECPPAGPCQPPRAGPLRGRPVHRRQP